MDGKKEFWSNLALAVISGYAGVIAIAAVIHHFGFASRPMEFGYPYTNYLSSAGNPGSFLLYLLLSAALGAALRQRFSVALGMALPWPVACGIEMHLDPTSHNLFPFEAIFLWLPAFLLAFLGAYLGRKLAARFLRDVRTEQNATDGQ